MEAEIINRGRGPEIKGTRITVYTILDYVKLGWHHSRIAADLRISSDQVLAAMQYIEEHKEEVMAAYQRILERSANARNPPWVEEKLAQGRDKLLALREQLAKEKSGEGNHARNGPG